LNKITEVDKVKDKVVREGYAPLYEEYGEVELQIHIFMTSGSFCDHRATEDRTRYPLVRGRVERRERDIGLSRKSNSAVKLNKLVTAEKLCHNRISAEIIFFVLFVIIIIIIIIFG
jgi:hypothetical protein